jgi:pantothenate kinase type III
MLLADCGNSRLKVACLCTPEVVTSLAYEDPALAERLASFDESTACVLSVSQAGAARFRDAWAGSAAELALPALGAYPGCGLDRQCAGVAACHELETDIVVVCLGTATVVDAWQWRRPWPRFLGGQLSPGPDAMLAGLSHRAPALPAVPWSADPYRSMLGHETADCMLAGVQTGFLGMLQAQIRAVQAATGIEAVLISGGYATCCRDGALAIPHRLVPDLVIRGMALLAASSPPAGSV